MGNTEETYYNIHKTITIAKNAIGVYNIRNQLKVFLQSLGYIIDLETITGIVVKIPNNDKVEIYNHMLSFMENCFTDHRFEILTELRKAGFPDGYDSIVIANAIHSYFIIPMSPYGLYGIKL